MAETGANRTTIAVGDVVHRYAGVLALDGVSLTIEPGTFTAVLGPNGAGKSTLAQILCGCLKPTAGRVALDGVTRLKPGRRAFVDDGIVLVPEGRRLFGQLSIRENLLLGAYGARCARPEIERRLEETLKLMPRTVREQQDRATATLSGGEQQMLAVGRAVMAAPRIVVLDEPSLGLAPILIDKMYEVLGRLNAAGVTVVVIEQIAAHAIRYAKSLTVLDRGRIVYAGSVEDGAVQEALRVGYLGRAA